MRLEAYFELKRKEGVPESVAAFARRADVGEAAIRKILAGGGATVSTAIKIIPATGGLVGLEDLAPEPTKRAGSSQKAVRGR